MWREQFTTVVGSLPSVVNQFRRWAGSSSVVNHSGSTAMNQRGQSVVNQSPPSVVNVAPHASHRDNEQPQPQRVQP